MDPNIEHLSFIKYVIRAGDKIALLPPCRFVTSSAIGWPIEDNLFAGDVTKSGKTPPIEHPEYL